MKILLAGFCVMLLGTFLAFADDTPQAKLPYQLVSQIQKSRDKLALTHTNIHFLLRMKSTFPDVKTADLAVVIDAKDGKIPVKLDDDGSFIVPLRDDLEQQNPWIVVNQPSGTMQLQWNVGINTTHPTNGIHYRAMMQPLQEVEAVEKEMSAKVRPLNIIGLKLSFPKANDQAVTLQLKSGDRKFKTDEKLEVTVPLDPAWLDEDPVIAFPDPPTNAEVATRVK